MSTVAIHSHNKDGNNAGNPGFYVFGRLNPGIYATGGVDVIAALRAAIVALRSDLTVNHIHSLVVGNPTSPNYVPAFDQSTQLLRIDLRSGGTASTVAWSDALVVAGDTTVAPAGMVLRVEATAGLTQACPIGYTAPDAAGEVQYVVTTNALNFKAADTVTACRALVMTAGTATTIAQIANAVDLTAVVQFDFFAVCD